MELKPLDFVMVDAIVAEACDHYVALTMDEVFGNTHLIVRPDSIHAPIASTREKIVKEIRAVEMSQSARGAVEAIINKHLGVRDDGTLLRKTSTGDPGSIETMSGDTGIVFPQIRKNDFL